MHRLQIRRGRPSRSESKKMFVTFAILGDSDDLPVCPLTGFHWTKKRVSVSRLWFVYRERAALRDSIRTLASTVGDRLSHRCCLLPLSHRHTLLLIFTEVYRIHPSCFYHPIHTFSCSLVPTLIWCARERQPKRNLHSRKTELSFHVVIMIIDVKLLKLYASFIC